MESFNFSLQDLLKKLIPGIIFIILTCFLVLKKSTVIEIVSDYKDISGILLILLICFAYVLGFFIDAFSSYCERQYYNCFYKPSYNLLNGKVVHGVELENREDVINVLTIAIYGEKYKDNISVITEKAATKLFKMANILKEHVEASNSNVRLSVYYDAKVFSRNLSVSLFSVTIFYLFYVLFHINLYTFSEFRWEVVLFIVFFTYISFYRWKIHAFYYTRQVFYMAYDSKRR